MNSLAAMTKSHPPVHQIELRVIRLAELFNSMDPTPFHRRALDRDVETYLESWAMGFPYDSHFRVIVHIDQPPDEDPAPLVVEAIHNYFAYKAVLAQRSLRQLLLEGRASLLIGLCFLSLCLLGADILYGLPESPFLRVMREGLIIGGWVAMWRPMQIFLYEWWPLLRRTRIYRNLGHANVHIAHAADQHNSPLKSQ